MENLALIILVTLLIINILVSIYLLRRDDLNKFQKIAQVVLVWLIPFIAALGFWLFHRSQDVEISRAKTPFAGGPPHDQAS